MFNPYAGVLRVTQTWADHVENGGSPGVDFGADARTPIIAPCDGVLHFFDNGSAGFDCVIYRSDGSSERAPALVRACGWRRAARGASRTAPTKAASPARRSGASGARSPRKSRRSGAGSSISIQRAPPAPGA